MTQTKERVVQEYVPGKQITLAHLIARPNKALYEKLGLSTDANAIGILTITPSEASIIASDIATKSGNVELGFLDRFTGSVVITGEISAISSGLEKVLDVMGCMGFSICEISRT
ncbi:MAG: BMC domain-containing protein [Vibrio sp.]